MPGTVSVNRRTEVVTLYQGDDRAAIYDAAAEVERAERDLRFAQAAAERDREAGPSRIGDGEDEAPAELVAAQERVAAARAANDALIDEATPRAVVITLGALKRLEFRTLRDEAGEPRKGNALDERLGFNVQAIADTLVMRCLRSPEMSDREKEEFLEDLSEADFDELSDTALTLNMTTGADPKGLRSSVATSRSSATP